MYYPANFGCMTCCITLLKFEISRPQAESYNVTHLYLKNSYVNNENLCNLLHVAYAKYSRVPLKANVCIK